MRVIGIMITKKEVSLLRQGVHALKTEAYAKYPEEKDSKPWRKKVQQILALEALLESAHIVIRRNK